MPGSNAVGHSRRDGTAGAVIAVVTAALPAVSVDDIDRAAKELSEASSSAGRLSDRLRKAVDVHVGGVVVANGQQASDIVVRLGGSGSGFGRRGVFSASARSSARLLGFGAVVSLRARRSGLGLDFGVVLGLCLDARPRASAPSSSFGSGVVAASEPVWALTPSNPTSEEFVDDGEDSAREFLPTPYRPPVSGDDRNPDPQGNGQTPDPTDVRRSIHAFAIQA